MILPLAGRTVLVTRPARQAPALVEPLVALGATVFAIATTEIRALEDTAPLDAALTRLDDFDWLVLTSANGVDAVSERMRALNLPRTKVCERRLAAVGTATAAAVASDFRAPDLVPARHSSDGLLEALVPFGTGRFMLARGNRASKILPDGLRSLGAIVDDVAAYEVVDAVGDPGLPNSPPDVITFTSSAAVVALVRLLNERGLASWIDSARIACIGPVTAETVRSLGFRVDLCAREATIPHLVEALLEEAAVA